MYLYIRTYIEQGFCSQLAATLHHHFSQEAQCGQSSTFQIQGDSGDSRLRPQINQEEEWTEYLGLPLQFTGTIGRGRVSEQALQCKI